MDCAGAGGGELLAGDDADEAGKTGRPAAQRGIAGQGVGARHRGAGAFEGADAGGDIGRGGDQGNRGLRTNGFPHRR